ncbi:hypothetical protein [Sphingobacterium humi]|uniref:Secretin/TonB short N-terminal domain-containing protein n=1 Tax=Sphingobacterium humi TaxID=1796905 RepID=A0A6N8L5U3_9SPHI|nr:hypothetical protein [Sphingobacterium humi]MVZ63122.1 hypothetical protein [Sphingobacterium humi]
MNINHHVEDILLLIPRQAFKIIFMRVQLIFLFLLLVLTQLRATDLKAQHLTIHVNGETLQHVLKEIRKQTGYDFVYNPEVLKVYSKTVHIEADNMSIKDLLKKLFDAQPMLQYTVDQNTVIVRPKKKLKPTTKIEMKQYRNLETLEWIIEGVVLDEDSMEPIEGVTILLEVVNSQIHAQSDKYGKFRLIISK